MDAEKRKAALYTRVSTEDQAKEGFSLDAQLEKLKAYCTARDWEIADTYIDDGYSGRNIRRPAYTRLIENMDSWDTLLVIKMDRIHRNSKNFMIMMEKLKEQNKEFVSMTESLDTSTAMGRFVMDIIQRIAQLESEQIGERVYDGMEQKARTNGGSLGFNIPYGYDFQYANKDFDFTSQAGGEKEAFDRLDEFSKETIFNYNKHISKPLESRTSCSRLSPYIAWGNISVRYVYQFIKNQSQLQGRIYTKAFRDRLRWHCHFIQKFEMEDRMEFQNINRGYDGIRDEINENLLEAFFDGKSGFPLVDACIRCLKSTGYINFRMRAMLVSFATHHLWLPWQSIAKFLAQHFLDFEPGIHYAQIQMQAGTTGTNTIRIYNPVKQSHDHDPEGIFIKMWIPELMHFPKEYIHEPWKMPPIIQQTLDEAKHNRYPLPIIDLGNTYREARERLWNARKKEITKLEAQRILKKHIIPRKVSENS